MSTQTNTLEPHSLYIMTTRVSSPAAFHWALLVTDTNGHAARYHWENTGVSSPTEVFQHEIVDPTAISNDRFNPAYAFLKVSGYVPAVESGTTVNEYCVENFRRIVPQGDPKWADRDWTMRALTILEEGGLISRPTPVAGLETVVIARTTEVYQISVRALWRPVVANI